MRNSKLVKIITVILAASILVLAAFATSAFASGDGTGEPATARVQIVSKNAAYESKTQLVFAVKCDDLQENEEICLLFWENAPETEGKTAEDLYKTANYKKTAYEKGVSILEVEGCELIASKGIPASKICSDLYVLPIIRTVDDSGDAPVYTYEKAAELFTYSVEDYANEKLADASITDAQNRLYRNLINYGKVCAEFFGASEN